MGFRAVDDDALQSELLGDTDGGGNVVRPVGVNVDGQLPSDHGQQGLQLGVIVGLVLLLVLRGSFQLLSILQGLARFSRMMAAVAIRVTGVSCRSL